MSAIIISDLEYAFPGGATLFFDASFKVAEGEHAALIGNNGVGKSTLMKILAGEITGYSGSINISPDLLYMSQAIGTESAQTIRDMLLNLAPPRLQQLDGDIRRAEKALDEGDHNAGITLGAAFTEWGQLGGYELEAKWDASIRRVIRSSLEEVGQRDVTEISGGERKQIVLDYLFASDSSTLLLDEPDNFLDVPAKIWFEQAIKESKKTILLISHDRDLLSAAVTKIITLESTGCWVHGSSYSSYHAARDHRQELLGDELKQWKDEERRLYRHYKLMKQRAEVNSKNAPKADAAETRWKKFAASGPPPAPVPNQVVHMRLRGGDSARRVAKIEGLGVSERVLPFSTEVYFGERVGLIGPNGSGKTSIMRALSGDLNEYMGSVTYGPRVSPGFFTQFNLRQEFCGHSPLNIVTAIAGGFEASMRALARYGLQKVANQEYETLSGGQKARLEVLMLELEGNNLLLLDEPTDNLDIDSSEALESALDQFIGTVITVSHDRAFLRKLDRYIMILCNGETYEFPDYESASAALIDPSSKSTLHRAKKISNPG